jgi:N-acetyl sugar amidotransferase
MQRKMNLVLLVADYPNPNGEPFLEEELKVIAAEFEHVYLLQTNASSNIAMNKMFVPLNATIHPLSKDTKKSLLSKIVFFFTFIFWYEVFLAVFKHKVRFSISLLKSINYYLVTSTVNQRLISQFIDQEKIDVNTTIFYSYWCDIYTFAIARLKHQFTSMHFVTRVHGWDLYFERHKESFLPFREYIFKQADRIFPVSQDGRKYLLDKRLIKDSSKIITSYLGVSSLTLNPRYTNKLLLDTKEIHVLSLSHINQVKRLDKILDALCLFSSDFHFVWHHIGWGEDVFEQTFKSIVADKLLHVPHLTVKFHGRYTKDAVRDFLQSVPIDFVVNSSDTEGVPVSLMEAAAAGIPAIAFDVGGIPAVLKDGHNGILIKNKKSDSVSALFEAITRFVTLSPDQRSQMSDFAISLWKSTFNQNENFKKFATILHESDIYVPEVIECSRCLVNSHVHPNIVLDKYGVCDICAVIDSKNAQLNAQLKQNYFKQLLSTVQSKGRNKTYDCVIGVSGGVDSAYLALKAKELGLRPLLVHVDNGWNSEIAVSNIEKLITQLELDLYTVVIDWEEIQDIVKSFMKASVIDIDWANEMCFVASLYKVARKFGIKSILTGHQLSSEGWMPETVVHYKLDLINFKAIHRRFGSIPLRTYPTIGYLGSFYYQKVLGIRYYYPLDYLGYDKESAKNELIDRYGWRDYGQKHFESIFTRFYQAYLLPRKFGVDKRFFHYSSLIASRQLSKEAAINLLTDTSYFSSGQFDDDKVYIQKKMGFSAEAFEALLISPPKSHFDYPSLFHFFKKWNSFKHKVMGL